MKTIEEQARETLLKVFAEVPFLKVKAVRLRPSSQGIDCAFDAEANGEKTRIIAEVEKVGQPRVVREALNRLNLYRASWPRAYPIFIAPFVSPEAAQLCVREQAGFLDFAGNCRLCFNQVFISKEGKNNRLTQKRDLRSIYSPRAERILRVLLANPAKRWKMQPLANEAKASLGLAANVKKLLADREWIRSSDDGFSLSEPEKLLAEWQQNYRSHRNQVKDYYSIRPIGEVEGTLAMLAENQRIEYALTGFSAAARYAPMVRYQRATAYVNDNLEGVATALELKPVASGGNVSLITPYDEGVFYGAERIAGANVTSPPQTYLDLKQLKARGEEAAEFLKEQVIEARWQVKR